MINFNKNLLTIYPSLKSFHVFKKWHDKRNDEMTAEERFVKLGGKLEVKKPKKDE